MESKIKHLEFIQNVITRMNSNSFIIKGWAITLISAVFALAAEDGKSQYIPISYSIITIFWLLDGFYLSQEKKYRKLYESVCAKSEHDIDFNMNASYPGDFNTSWMAGIFSKTLFPVYGILIVIAILAKPLIG